MYRRSYLLWSPVVVGEGKKKEVENNKMVETYEIADSIPVPTTAYRTRSGPPKTKRVYECRRPRLDPLTDHP